MPKFVDSAVASSPVRIVCRPELPRHRADRPAPLGTSVPGIGRWLDILEATGQIFLVPPYFEDLGKRLIKSPKVYIADSGLACHLLGRAGVTSRAAAPGVRALPWQEFVTQGWV